MSFDKCLLLLHVQDKLPVADIRDTAKQYQEDGVPYVEAMRRATQEHLDLARAEESRIITLARQKYVEAGGKLNDRLPADAQPSRQNSDHGNDAGYNDPHDKTQVQGESRRVGADRIGAHDYPGGEAGPLRGDTDLPADASGDRIAARGNKESDRDRPEGLREEAKQVAADAASTPPADATAVRWAPADGLVPPEQQLPQEALEHLVHATLSGLEGAPPVFVLDSPKALAGHGIAGVKVEVASGAMVDGKLFLFRNGLRDVAAARATIWHELFHYGLRKVMTPEAYSSAMTELYNSDPNVKILADRWAKSDEASERQAGGVSVTDLHILSVEEGLARLAEVVGQRGPDYVGQRDMPRTVRNVLSWMAKVADRLGLAKVGITLRTMTLSKGERFIASIFDRTAAGERPAEQTMADLDRRSINFRNSDGAERDPEADKSALSRLISVPKAALQSVLFHTRMLVVPMAAGDGKAMAMAKDFANHNRRAAAQWQAFDKVLRTHYTDEQLQKMWTAADQENDLRRAERTSTTEGLATLDAGERKTVELLHAYGEQLWAKARDAGLVEGDGVAFWTPRVAARIVDDGSVEAIRQPSGEFSKEARNLRTSASSTKQRQHETTAESEAALKAKLGDDAEYVKNIRVMPLAMAQLERAIVGRTLVNQIRAHGKVAGEDLISDQSGPNFVTFDHPALKQWRPRADWQPADMAKLAERGHEVKADGVYQGGEKLASYRVQAGAVEKLGPLLDSEGKPVMESTPIYVRKDFAGPLKAVFTKEQNAVYRGLMNLKGAVTSMIMISPLTHNLVIWGKAMPTMVSTMGWANNLKNAGTLGLHGYFVGSAARADHALMGELIEAGLVPVYGRGMNPDVEAIGNGLKPGRSLTAQAIGHVFDLASPKAGDLARRGVDKAGEVWHEKLLWDRVADLQAGMAVMMRTSLMDKGVDQYTANRLATHFANRYAGMIPQEAMSQGAHMLLNLSLFSKSFTMTNLGAYKDLAGLPKDVQAQIKIRTFEIQRALGRNEEDASKAAGAAVSTAQSIARKKAAAVLILDVAAMTTIGSLAQALWQGQTGQQIADDFKDRLAKLGHKLKDDPLSIIGHPLDALSSLSQTADNPHGREDRVRVGEDDQGNSYYARLPVGKVGEELKHYGNVISGLHLSHNKLSTFLKPIAELTANEDFNGREIIDPHANVIVQLVKFGAYWVKGQLPVEDLTALAHLAKGDGDHMDKLKLLGTATGLSVGRLAGGDAVAEMRFQMREHESKLRNVLPDVREAVRRDNVDLAQQLLEDAGQTPREIQQTIRRIDQPDRVSKQQLRRFNQLATDDERARLDRMRSR